MSLPVGLKLMTRASGPEPRSVIVVMMAGITRTAWAVLSMVVAVTACGGSAPDPSAVPPEFRAACGHPGAHVAVRHVPVTVPHAECDLTGVAISYGAYGGATVPRQGGVGIANSFGFTLTVAAGSLDVTITAPSGPPGNL